MRPDHTTPGSPYLSVVVPTRNERENIARLLVALREALAGCDYELVFVDDSTDGTDAVLSEAALTDPRVRVHHRANADGLAGAVVAGFCASRGQVLGVLDADLQHPPAVLAALVRRLEEARADVAVASRYLPGAGRPGLSPARRVISQATRLLAWAMLGAARRSTDPLSGCFVLRRSVVEGVALRPVGFKILLEVLARGRYRSVAEVPYVFEARGAGQTKATARQGLDLLRHIAMLVTDSPSDSRLWKFLLVGASGVGVNMGTFWLLVGPLRAYYLHAGIVAGLVSTFTNFLLNNAYTWADRRDGALTTFLQRMGKYYMATWLGYLVYLGFLWGLTRLGLLPMVSNFLAIGLGGLLNFVVHNFWTWRQR